MTMAMNDDISCVSVFECCVLPRSNSRFSTFAAPVCILYTSSSAIPSNTKTSNIDI